MVPVTFFLGVAAYSAAATLYFVNVARRDEIPQLTTWAPRAQLFGTLLHFAHLLLSSWVTMTCPVASLPFALSLSALVMSAGHLLWSRRYAVQALGVAVVPLALACLIGAEFVGSGSQPTGLSPVLLALHVTASLLGLALFLLAGMAGGFYLFEERRLKHKKGRALFGRLPPLDVLDSAEHRLLLAGFPLLTFGMISGAVLMNQFSDMSVTAWIRASLAYLSWTLVAAVLLLRSLAGWRGRRTAYGTLLGVGCLLLIIGAYVVRASLGGAA